MMKVPCLHLPSERRCLLALLACCTFGAQAFAGVEQAVNDLIPRLAAQKVEDRYAPQMELQSLALNAARPGAEAERAELAAILAARATDAAVPQPARVWIVRQLEYIGGAESVPALTALLGGQDAELKECARRALEKDPAPGAVESLRGALEKGGDTVWRIGLIQSLGERRDAKSVGLITPCLQSKETASAASSALGKIATDDAVAALWTAYDAGAAGAADALVTAGNRLLVDGNKAAAAHLFGRLYSPSLTTQGAKDPAAPVQVRSAALIGWAAAADPGFMRREITKALQEGEPRLQFAAVTAATVACGKARVSDFLAPLLPKLPPAAAIYVLRVLDAAAERQIIAATAEPDEAVQLAALERLGQVGGALGVPVLVKIASEDASARQKVAATALASISGRGADAAIIKAAAQGDPKTRATAIYALSGRNEQSSLPSLMKYAGESDRMVSGAACAALGKMGGDQELEGLARIALKSGTPDVEDALRAVASRTRDKADASKRLLVLLQGAEPRQQALLFRTLTILGGSEAMDAISSYASGASDQVKDAAIRALANWPDFAATRPLLVIAADPNATRVHSVLAIQAVVRLVKSADKEPAASRLEAAQAAMRSAKRDEEKKLVMSAFASVPDAKAAAAIKPFLSDPNLKSEAGLAGVTLAEVLLKTDKPAARSLAQAVKDAGFSEDLTRKAEAVLRKN